MENTEEVPIGASAFHNAIGHLAELRGDCDAALAAYARAAELDLRQPDAFVVVALLKKFLRVFDGIGPQRRCGPQQKKADNNPRSRKRPAMRRC